MFKRKRLMIKWLVLILFVSSVAQAQQLISKVIPVEYAQPEKLVSALNPMLQSGESISVYEHSLIVSVSPETLTKIRPLIHQLDVAPTIFLVSIHQGDANWLDGQEDAIHYGTTSGRQQADNQAVQVQNGSSAFVSTGADYPVINQVGIGWETGVGYQRMKSDKGFLILPELKGAKVALTIKRNYSQQNPTDQQSQQEQQSATTTIIPLNKWTKLVQTGGPENNSDQSTHYHAGSSFDTNGTLFIKISILKNN